jgi:flagellin-like hook-associated protein FlgL
MPMPLTGLAQTLSNSVATIQAQIVDTQNQLASGTKTLDPASNGVVTRLSAQASAYGTVQNNITTAQNVISVGETALSSVASILTQMKQIATQAASGGLQTTDLNSLNTTYTNLEAQAETLISGAAVNGANVLGGTPLVVTTGIDGATNTTVAAQNVTTAALQTILTGATVTVANSVVNPTATTVTASSVASSAQTFNFTGVSSTSSVGQTVTVGGLTFTAGATGWSSTDNLSTLFKNYISSGGSQPSVATGSFSGSLGLVDSNGNATQATADSGSSILTLTAVGNDFNALTASSASSAATNANKAIAALTAALTSISTDQANLSAASTGFAAQLTSAKSLQTGLQNTVGVIQNIDATAMQAKLQQLNNQQSIDYYLVSQMNTEAAAILSIFR